MVPFETSAITPGQMYQVRASCNFAGRGDVYPDEYLTSPVYYSVPGGALLLAIGCTKKASERREGGVTSTAPRYIFRFLWDEKEIHLPLTMSLTFGEPNSAELHQELQNTLELFVRPIVKRTDVVAVTTNET